MAKRRVLLLKGYAGVGPALARMGAALAASGYTVREVEAGADTDRARAVYAEFGGSDGETSLIGVGIGCVQALLLAEGFPAAALVCALPDADGKRAGVYPRMLARSNLFAVVAPTLVVDRPGGRAGRRLYEGVGARDKRFALCRAGDEVVQTILEHLRRTDAIYSLACRHDLGIK